MQLSQNICAVQNLGQRRYVCYEHNGQFAYIDVLEKDNEVWSFVQSGIHGRFLQSGSPFKGRTESESVHQAFASLKDCSWLRITQNNDIEIAIPIVFKDYQLNLFV